MLVMLVVLLMNPKQARGLGSVKVSGIYLYREMVRSGSVDDFAVLTSTAVPDGTVIAVAAALGWTGPPPPTLYAELNQSLDQFT